MIPSAPGGPSTLLLLKALAVLSLLKLITITSEHTSERSATSVLLSETAPRRSRVRSYHRDHNGHSPLEAQFRVSYTPKTSVTSRRKFIVNAQRYHGYGSDRNRHDGPPYRNMEGMARYVAMEEQQSMPVETSSIAAVSSRSLQALEDKGAQLAASQSECGAQRRGA